MDRAGEIRSYLHQQNYCPFEEIRVCGELIHGLERDEAQPLLDYINTKIDSRFKLVADAGVWMAEFFASMGLTMRYRIQSHKDTLRWVNNLPFWKSFELPDGDIKKIRKSNGIVRDDNGRILVAPLKNKEYDRIEVFAQIVEFGPISYATMHSDGWDEWHPVQPQFIRLED